MFLKCVWCGHQRSLSPISTLRSIRTSALYFNSDKGSYSSQGNIGDKPKKKFLNMVKDHREKNMTIEKVPQNESIGTLLKVQRISQDIPKDFKPVYKFPAIKYFGLVNRLKIYQTAITIIASIGSTILCAIGIVSPSLILVTTVLGISGCLTLYSLGYVVARFVGFIYYNEKTEMVRIAYVDFWGRRRDIEVPVSDIMPRNEAPEGWINKVWFPLRRYSTDEILKLQLQSGIILDQKALKRIL